MIRLSYRKVWLWCALITAACADSPRENIVDPVVAPTIEMSAPVWEGTSILIEWRYVSEGSLLDRFSIRKIVGESVEIANVNAGTASGFQSASFRDSTLLSEVEVTYRVVGLAADGGELGSASGSIRIEGAPVAVSADPELRHVVISWGEAPAGATGFRVLRSEADLPAETIFSTDSPSPGQYVDTTVVANTVYTYQHVTDLSGVDLRSPDQSAGMWVVTHTGLPEPAVLDRTIRTTLAPINQAAGGFNRLTDFGVLYVGDQNSIRAPWDLDDQREPYVFVGGPPDQLTMPGYSPESVSITIPGGGMYASMLSLDKRTAHVVRFPGSQSTYDAEFAWQPDAATRTGLVEFSVVRGQLLMYAGLDLRIVNRDLELIEEMQIVREPIDIEYDGSIWLVYPDQIRKSEETQSLLEVNDWQTIEIPSDVEIAALTLFKGKIVVLDAVARRVYLLSETGEVLVSWEAQGDDLTNGDVLVPSSPEILYQTDGKGRLFTIEPNIPLGATQEVL